MNTIEKNLINNLYNLLEERTNKSKEILDILDVLSQVNKKLDKERHPEVLINKLNQYIRITASTGKIKFSNAEAKLTIESSIIGQKAGINGSYMADFSDKSQFYKFPRRPAPAMLPVPSQPQWGSPEHNWDRPPSPPRPGSRPAPPGFAPPRARSRRAAHLHHGLPVSPAPTPGSRRASGTSLPPPGETGGQSIQPTEAIQAV